MEVVWVRNAFISSVLILTANIVFLPQTATIVEIFPYGFERPTFKVLASNKVLLH